MALSKKIGLGNGVVVNYHRVVRVDTITNVQNVIEVCSYTSKSKREEERDAIAAGEPFNVYTSTAWHVAPYDQFMTVEGAYEWLKSNVPDFEGASDVLEEDEEA